MCLTTTFNPIYATDPLSFEFFLKEFLQYFRVAKMAVSENQGWNERGLPMNYLLLASLKNARNFAFAVKDDTTDKQNNVKEILADKKFSHVAHLFCDLEDLSEGKAVALLRQVGKFKDWYNLHESRLIK